MLPTLIIPMVSERPPSQQLSEIDWASPPPYEHEFNTLLNLSEEELRERLAHFSAKDLLEVVDAICEVRDPSPSGCIPFLKLV